MVWKLPVMLKWVLALLPFAFSLVVLAEAAPASNEVDVVFPRWIDASGTHHHLARGTRVYSVPTYTLLYDQTVKGARQRMVVSLMGRPDGPQPLFERAHGHATVRFEGRVFRDLPLNATVTRGPNALFFLSRTAEPPKNFGVHQPVYVVR